MQREASILDSEQEDADSDDELILREGQEGPERVNW